jgi:hypothetical protein
MNSTRYNVVTRELQQQAVYVSFGFLSAIKRFFIHDSFRFSIYNIYRDPKILLISRMGQATQMNACTYAMRNYVHQKKRERA